MTTHSFVSSNNVGSIGESIFFSLLSRLGNVESVVTDKEYQAKGVDFVLDGVYYDTKLDTKANHTGNVALETVSVKKDGSVVKQGWVHTTQADCVTYIFLAGTHWNVLFFTPYEMQKMVATPNYQTKQIKNYGYESEVVLVPLADLEHKSKLLVPIVGDLEDISLLEKVHSYLKEHKE